MSEKDPSREGGKCHRREDQNPSHRRRILFFPMQLGQAADTLPRPGSAGRFSIHRAF